MGKNKLHIIQLQQVEKTRVVNANQFLHDQSALSCIFNALQPGRTVLTWLPKTPVTTKGCATSVYVGGADGVKMAVEAAGRFKNFQKHWVKISRIGRDAGRPENP